MDTDQPKPAPEPPHYGFIDTLRGFAFLGVLVAHIGLTAAPSGFDHWATVGNQGVQLFFIASALTLFLSFKARSARESSPVRNFFIRRVFRIAPLFWFGIALYSFIPAREIVPGHEVVIGFWHYLSTALFLHGWNVETMNSVVPGGWSIAVEMMFYLSVPLLWRWIRSVETAVWWFLGSLIALPALNWTVSRLFGLDGSDMLDVFYLIRWLPAQAPVFLLGILLYHTIQRIGTGLKSASAGHAMMAVAIFLVMSLRGINTARFLPAPVAISCGLWCFALSLHLWPSRIIVNALTRFIGKVSYSAYITHFTSLFILAHLVPSSLFGASREMYFLFLFAAGLPLTLAFSWCTYRLIEIPGERLGREIIRRLETERPVMVTTSPARPARTEKPQAERA